MTDDLLDPNRGTDTERNAPEYPQVGDDEQIAQRRSHERVQALLDEITNVQIREANDLDGEYSPAEHRQAYHQTVVELWRELQPTLAEASGDTESFYWFNIDLGEFTVEPPKPLQKPTSRIEAESRPDLQPGASWATPEEYDITGFQQFANMDTVIRTRFAVRLDEDDITVPELRQQVQRADPDAQVRVWDRSRGDFEEPFRVDKFKLLPKWVIDNARGALREFAEKSGHGFGKPDAIEETEDDPV